MFLDHTQWRSTVGRTPLDEWSARPEESYRLCCVIVCDLETSRMVAPYIYIYIYDISHLRVKTIGHQYKSHESISFTWSITSGCPKIILLYCTSSIHIPSDGKTRLWIVGSLISTVCRNASWMTFCSSALGTTFSSDCCWNCIRRFFLTVNYCKLYLVNIQKANFKTSNILSHLFSLPHIHLCAHVCVIHKHKLSNILWYTRL